MPPSINQPPAPNKKGSRLELALKHHQNLEFFFVERHIIAVFRLQS